MSLSRNHPRVWLLLGLIILAQSLCPYMVMGIPGETWILFRSDIPLFRALARELATQAAISPVLCPLESVSASFLESRPPSLIIGLGDSGLRRAMELSWDVPILGVLAEKIGTNQRVISIPLRPPHQRQSELARILAPERTILVYPYAVTDFAPGAEVKAAAESQKFELASRCLTSPKDWPGFFQALPASSGWVLLAMDPGLMNSAFVSSLLLESFRKQIPVIGFSSSLVQQGALFALVLSPEKTAHELARFAQRMFAPESKGARLFSPKECWDLYLNATVARKFGLTIPVDLLDAARRVF
jgi:hypothetical protein